MPKCHLKSHFGMGFSPVNLLHIFRTRFPKNTSLLMTSSIIVEFTCTLFRYHILGRFKGVFRFGPCQTSMVEFCKKLVIGL